MRLWLLRTLFTLSHFFLPTADHRLKVAFEGPSIMSQPRPVFRVSVEVRLTAKQCARIYRTLRIAVALLALWVFK